MQQYIKVDLDLLKNKDLGTNEILAYALLCDRMKSSWVRKSFYDKKMEDYFVIYTREEMGKKLGVSEKTVTKVYKNLRKAGLLVKKQVFNGPSKLFLPEYQKSDNSKNNHSNTSSTVKSNGSEHISPRKMKNGNSNQKNITSYKQTIYTRDTCSETNSKKNVNSTQKEKSAAKQKKLNKLEIDALSSSLETKAGFSKRTTNMLKALSFNDPKKLYQLSGIVFKAKNVVKKQARNVENSQLALSFENNNRYEDMAVDIQRIVMTANRSKRSNVEGYIFSSLVNYFQEAVNDYCSHDVQSVIS